MEQNKNQGNQQGSQSNRENQNSASTSRGQQTPQTPRSEDRKKDLNEKTSQDRTWQEEEPTKTGKKGDQSQDKNDRSGTKR